MLVLVIRVAQRTEASPITGNTVNCQVAVCYHIVESFQLSDVHDPEANAFQDLSCSSLSKGTCHVKIKSIVFTALHGMQMRSSDENSARLSVRPSVKNVTKRKKNQSRFL